MRKPRWVKSQDGIAASIEKMLGRKVQLQSYLNRVAYPRYQQAQIARWESENQSETGQWDELSAQYARRKLIEFASFPGGGKALMVATGALSKAAMGQGAGALKVISGNKMIVGIDDGAIPYGKYAAGRRPILLFGDATVEHIAGSAMRYFMTGEE